MSFIHSLRHGAVLATGDPDSEMTSPLDTRLVPATAVTSGLVAVISAQRQQGRSLSGREREERKREREKERDEE